MSEDLENIEKRVRSLEQFRSEVGEKMLTLEISSIEKLTRLQASADNLEKRIPDWITRVEFRPVMLVTYGLVSIILTAVVTAVVALVVTGKLPS